MMYSLMALNSLVVSPVMATNQSISQDSKIFIQQNVDRIHSRTANAFMRDARKSELSIMTNQIL